MNENWNKIHKKSLKYTIKGCSIIANASFFGFLLTFRPFGHRHK